MANNTDVLIIGAGPIGLLNAWAMKQLNPSLTIEVLEKYPQYQRTHTLVMDWKPLQAVMEATHSETHPVLAPLLARLKKDPHIRTNELQTIFADLATTAGVTIQNKDVKEESLEAMLDEEYPNLKFVLGADGTHSVVSRTLFGKDNIVKYDYDYVLQLRFEINGDEQPKGLSTSLLFEEMARKGLVANEYVGHSANGKTPVTMQMMISKEDFLALQEYTSKNPLRPRTNTQGESKLPPHLAAFVNGYLLKKIQDLGTTGQSIDRNYSISVNEAPATHAKQLVTHRQEVPVMLTGDAALGLSYFKGLNAGVEASARFIKTMEPVIIGSFADTVQRDAQLDAHQTWFLKDFSPKKVNEVGSYSFWRIRSVMKMVGGLRWLINASERQGMDDFRDELVQDYFEHVTKKGTVEENLENWEPFPHRVYQPVNLGELGLVPLRHTGKKITKLFADYGKPYKGWHQVAQDFKQPLVGLNNFFVGLFKIGKGIFTWNGPFFLDGAFTLLRGLLELITTPVAWVIKPLTRTIATLAHGGFKEIEENTNFQTIAKYGQDFLELGQWDTNAQSYLLGISNDLHRKFMKASERGQDSDLKIEEFSHYAAIRRDVNHLDKQTFVNYFSLFAKGRDKPEEASALSSEDSSSPKL